MSRFFRPPIGDPLWDSFWTSERSFFDTHFGSTLTEEDFLPSNYFVRRRPVAGVPRSPLMAPHSPIMAQQMHPLAAAAAAGQAPGAGSQPGDLIPQLNNAANDKYQIMVDVSHFNPEEISVKMVDNAIVVTGKHEDKADNYGYVSRQFSRKYLLPADVEPETVTSTLSADGILTIQAPRKPLQISDSAAGRSVPIAISNQALSPALNLVPPQFPGTVPVNMAPGATSQVVQQQQQRQEHPITVEGGGTGTISIERTTTKTTKTSTQEGTIGDGLGMDPALLVGMDQPTGTATAGQQPTSAPQ